MSSFFKALEELAKVGIQAAAANQKPAPNTRPVRPGQRIAAGPPRPVNPLCCSRGGK